MDIHLPEGSGLELMKKILLHYPETKVIIMTGYEVPIYQELAAQYGAFGFFSKGEVTGRDILALVKPFQPVAMER
jgi:DNA-binding NarL/FixJ family response regulator